MLGTRFELDEEKILRENIYDLDMMYAKIEEFAIKRAGLTKVSKNHYEFRGEKNAQAHLGIFNFNCLLQCEWFTKNVKSWEWLDDQYGKDYSSDIIANAKKYNQGVWA
ncbi:hypothetical protein [Helicobacter typhlonius]|uniref:Uncharacterized protein n=1 Tax=Helicobacter typhlonius TaxID=76936 RepID=A0A099UH26_9HELI|nr:hypothetical protein [Helicobacter typhlonius]TLD79239.1 hypothetical protein LS75_002805 [Helicobacter typhlonius]CUU40590.1 Hypothetical protein BN2458_PEG1707 [Helicobacter typhlonius]